MFGIHALIYIDPWNGARDDNWNRLLHYTRNDWGIMARERHKKNSRFNDDNRNYFSDLKRPRRQAPRISNRATPIRTKIEYPSASLVEIIAIIERTILMA